MWDWYWKSTAVVCNTSKNVSRTPGIIGVDLNFVRFLVLQAYQAYHIDTCGVDGNTSHRFVNAGHLFGNRKFRQGCCSGFSVLTNFSKRIARHLMVPTHHGELRPLHVWSYVMLDTGVAEIGRSTHQYILEPLS